MSITDDNNIVPFRTAPNNSVKQGENWLSELGQDAMFLARLNAEYRSKRGITATELVEFHVVDRETPKSRLLRSVKDYMGQESIFWVSPSDFCKEWELVELKDAGKP